MKQIPFVLQRGKRKLRFEIQFEKVGAGDGYLFENPILMQQQQDPPRVRMKRFSNGQQLHICKISENLKTFKFSTTTQNLWSRHGMGCFLFFSEENLSR